MKVTIIVPVFNAEKFLDRCIESLIFQEHKDLQILLIDDGSSDNSPNICDDWGKKDKRIDVIHQKNAGVCHARNVGINKSKGEFVCFVDSDDFISIDYVSSLLKKQEETGADMVFGKIQKYTKDGEIIEYKEDLENFCKNPSLANFFVGNIGVGLVRMLIRKSLINDLRFDETLHYSEDLNFIAKLLIKSTNIAYIDKFIYNYVVNISSVTHNQSLDRVIIHHNGIKANAKLLRENGLDEIALAYEYGFCMRSVFYYLDIKDAKQLFLIYNDKIHYKAYLKNMEKITFSMKILAFLVFHKMFWIVKFIKKIMNK